MEPPNGLLEKILNRIHHEERILVLRKIIVFSVTLTGSLAGLVPAFRVLLSDFGRSGFLRFFSLIFSDFSAVAAYWQNFVLILLESLPILSLAVFLAVLIIFLQSIRALTKNVKIMVKRKEDLLGPNLVVNM